MALQAVGPKTYVWNNKLKSAFLLLGFPFLLLLMLGVFFGAVFGLGLAQGIPGVYQGLGNNSYTGQGPMQGFSWPEFYQGFIYGAKNYWSIAIMGACIWFVIAFFFHQRMINRATGAHPVTRQEEPKIYNMLENLSISRGLIKPKLFIIETEIMNAYASGISTKSYGVTLTRGLINNLNDDELEAVLAHELSHILNRDVQLLIVAVIFVGMISFFAEMMWRNLRFTSRRRSKGAAPVLLIAGIILMLGYGLAILLRFTLSRRREYLADAGACELTKKPEAMINALRKIEGHAKMEAVPKEVAQMFIENPASISEMFGTHPPIEKRINILIEIFNFNPTELIETPAISADIKRKGPWGFFRIKKQP